MLKMDRCKLEQPKVIDNEMLEKCIEEQAFPGEAGRLQREEGIPLNEIKKLRLEFLRILRIDHLWMLTALTKLSLCNNLIEHIENLDSLTNLKELDLSFNKITKIENLDTLINIEILTLFENCISTIENMDSLNKLIIFSIGNNHITNKNNVTYLRKFVNLKSVNMAGNPCTEKEDDFLIFVSTFLPQITYYQYKLVDEEDRKIGRELHSELLNLINIDEFKRKQVQDEIEANIAEEELHADSFVEFLGSRYLFDEMFKTDNEGKAFLTLGTNVETAFTEYEQQYTTITKQIFAMGQVQYKIRKTEVELFFNSVNSAKIISQNKSIEKMEDFLTQKAEIFYEVKRLEEDLENNEISIDECNAYLQQFADEYNDMLHKVWKELMSFELTLYEQMEEVIQTFEQSVTEMINNFIETAQGYFVELRTLEQNYMDIISGEAIHFQSISVAQEKIHVPDELKLIMSDKDLLINALGSTHDCHMQTIDLREDTLINRARNWLNNLIGGLQKVEVERNRGKVLEINHFLDIQREEFEESQAFAAQHAMLDPEITADLTAVLN